MMHEHDPSLRVTNIVVKNFRSSRDGNLLRAYSVDGLKLEHLTINSANNSALRVFHSSDINMTRCDLRGGTGSYTVMFIKCRKANITRNYFHSTGYRSLSFKGAIHKSGTSIFNSLLTTDYEDAQIDIYDNVFDYDWDCAFIDWPPDSGDDVGDVNGLTIGFTKAEWYGRFRGIKFHDNMCSFVGTYSNGKGRTFWASYPHEKITIENNTILNGGFFLAGVDGGSITGNNLTWTKQSANAIFIQDETGTTPATVTRNISIRGNRLYNYYAAGTGGGTDPEIFYADGLSIDIEENYFYGIATTGVPNLIVIGPSLDHSSIQRNRAYLDSGVAILANIVLSTFGAVNNLHGTTSDNTVFDTATGVTKTAGMVIFDNAAGSGFQIIAKGGYAGIGLMASNKVDYLGQFYEDLANTNLVIYHNTAPRITVKADGSSEFSSYLTLEETTDPTAPLTNKANIYLKDNGSGLTEPFYQTSDGLVNPFGLFYRSGADAVYTNSAAIVSIYNKLSRWYHDDDYNLGLGASVFGSLSGGGSNVGVGREAGQAFTTADNNVAVGVRALSQSTGGTDNVAIGGQAMRGAGALADKATMLGESAGFNFSGTRSVHIGRRAGQNYTNSYNTLIGADIGERGTSVPTVTNTVAIGYGVTPRATSTAQIGTNGVSSLYLNGTVGWFRGSGSPESAVTAPIGSFYSQEDGGIGTAFYVKQAGTGDTGWSAPNRTSFGLAYSFGATPYTVTDSYADLNTGSVVQTDVLTTGTYLVTATILIHCPADFTAQTAFVKLVNTESAADLTGSETWSYFGALTALHSQQVTTSALTTITTSGRVKVQVKNGNPATGELAVSETPGCRVTWIKVL
jgi:hypothetical protein